MTGPSTWGKCGALGGTRTRTSQIRRFPYGYPPSFRSVGDLGRVPGERFMLVWISERSFAPVAPSVTPGRAG
jgi:hypothetical protein